MLLRIIDLLHLRWQAVCHRVAAALLVHKKLMQVAIRQVEFQLLVLAVGDDAAEAPLLRQHTLCQVSVFVEVFAFELTETLQVTWRNDRRSRSRKYLSALMDRWKVVSFVVALERLLACDGMRCALIVVFLVHVINIQLLLLW